MAETANLHIVVHCSELKCGAHIVGIAQSCSQLQVIHTNLCDVEFGRHPIAVAAFRMLDVGPARNIHIGNYVNRRAKVVGLQAIWQRRDRQAIGAKDHIGILRIAVTTIADGTYIHLIISTWLKAVDNKSVFCCIIGCIIILAIRGHSHLISGGTQCAAAPADGYRGGGNVREHHIVGCVATIDSVESHAAQVTLTPADSNMTGGSRPATEIQISQHNVRARTIYRVVWLECVGVGGIGHNAYLYRDAVRYRIP